DIRSILRRDALHQRALFALRTRRRVTANLPVAMDGFDRALRLGVIRERQCQPQYQPQYQPDEYRGAPEPRQRPDPPSALTLRHYEFPRSAAEPPPRARQHRSHSPTRLPRPAYSLRPPCQGIKAKSLWPAEGRLRPWMIAQDQRFIGVLGLSAAAAAIMSALQQSPICGLEEPEIPLSRRGPPGTSRRGTR